MEERNPLGMEEIDLRHANASITRLRRMPSSGKIICGHSEAFIQESR